MKRILLVLFFVIGSLFQLSAKTVPAKKTDTKPAYLFVLHAKGGEISKKGSEYTLKLISVSDHMTYFTDRPNRKAGKVPLSEFLEEWNKGKDNFHQNPPNAGLAILESDAKISKSMSELVIELTKPKYAKKNKTLEFTIKPIPEGQTLPEKSFNEISLFIDEGWGSCNCKSLR